VSASTRFSSPGTARRYINNGAYLTRAPAAVERAAFRMAFGRRADELLAALSGDVAPVASKH
jgi:hypothetical protein